MNLHNQKSKSVDEILGELINYVAGRGNDSNFCYSKRYSLKSYIRCIDFSPWINKKLVENDIFSLVVFEAQLSKDAYIGRPPIPFELEFMHDEVWVNNILKFSFNEYFIGDFEAAKNDIMTAFMLNYPGMQLSKILLAYRIYIKNLEVYKKQYEKIKIHKMISLVICLATNNFLNSNKS